jgi:hypothetical protein
MLAACGPPDPPVAIDDPRAYVREQLVATATPSWADGRTDYNLDDLPFLDSLIDARVERDARLDGALPTDQRSLDRFISRLGSYYSTATTASAARRAEVEARVRGRFESPPATFDPETQTAHADLGIATARFRPDRTSWRLLSVETVSNGTELAPEAVARAFGRLHTEPPDARVYHAEARILTVSGARDVRYTYSTESDELEVLDGLDFRYESPEPIGGIGRLIGGEAATQTDDLARLCEDIDARATYRC